jgi:AraC-like DNA-binding protein
MVATTQARHEEAIAIVVARGILMAAASLGASLPEIIGAAGLDAATLATDDARVSHETIQTLVAESVRRSRNDNFGLHMAEMLHANIVLPLPLHYALRSSPTVEEGARRLIRYSRLIADYAAFELTRTSARRAHFSFRAHTRLPGRQLTECVLAVICLWLRLNCERDFRLHEVSFTHPRPASIVDHERIFRTRVRFNRSVDELVFDSAQLAWPLMHGDSQLASVLDQFLEQIVPPMFATPSFVMLVRQKISERMTGAVPSMAVIAECLHLSQRTLQRRLSDAASSYTGLVDAVRRERAARHLEDASFSISEVAFMLGFSDVSTFHRAVKRWYGTTPAKVRGSALKHV